MKVNSLSREEVLRLSNRRLEELQADCDDCLTFLNAPHRKGVNPEFRHMMEQDLMYVQDEILRRALIRAKKFR